MHGIFFRSPCKLSRGNAKFILQQVNIQRQTLRLPWSKVWFSKHLIPKLSQWLYWFGYQGPEHDANIASSSSKTKDTKPKRSDSEIKHAQEEIKSLKSQLQKQKRTAPEDESRYRLIFVDIKLMNSRDRRSSCRPNSQRCFASQSE